MRWLVSYRYRVCFRESKHRRREYAPIDHVELIEEHPAVFFAEMQRRHNRWTDNGYLGPGAERSDELICIHSVIDVPDGLLTEAQIEALS
jgi:hypothetical protein